MKCEHIAASRVNSMIHSRIYTISTFIWAHIYFYIYFYIYASVYLSTPLDHWINTPLPLFGPRKILFTSMSKASTEA